MVFSSNFSYCFLKMRCKHTLQKGENLNSIGNLVKNKRIYQRGYNNKGFNNLHSKGFYVVRRQRGKGFTSVLLGLSRFLIPLIQSGYKAIKSEAVSAGTDILRDFKNKHLEDIVKKRSQQAVKNLKEKASNKIDTMMKGEGLRRKKRKKTIKRRRPRKNIHTLKLLKRTRSGPIIIKKRKPPARKSKSKSKKIDIQKIFG